MTQYWDIFGTDDFYDEYSDAYSKLSTYDSYIANNAASQYEDALNVSVNVTDHSIEVPVDVEESASNPDLTERRVAAEDWLSHKNSYNQYDNFGQYGSSSICIVFDYIKDTQAGGESTPFAGVNTNEYKTCIINPAVIGSFFSDAFVGSHEVGHMVGCGHDNAAYYTSAGVKECTFMHTSADVNTTCTSSDSDGLDDTLAEYSDCAENQMHT